MSLDVSRITKNEHGEPTVTITLTGFSDIYRFAHHMEHGQVEFGEAGRGIIRRLRRRVPPGNWNSWMRQLHGPNGRPGGVS